ncbi:MAG TPA: hypothetical protein VNH53_05200 [Sphingomicrobium sp.]|jgi:hypothetical protein|nr:hypothetical protein [Sphingomicrobium sp.]
MANYDRRLRFAAWSQAIAAMILSVSCSPSPAEADQTAVAAAKPPSPAEQLRYEQFRAHAAQANEDRRQARAHAEQALTARNNEFQRTSE